MRRSRLLDQFGNEMPDAASRGMTRRSLILSTAATIGGVAAAGYAWNRFTDSLETTENSSGGRGSQDLITGEPLAIMPNGMLLDTDFKDPFAGGEFLGYLPFRSREEDGFQGQLYENSGGGHNARLCIDLASLLTPAGRLTPSDQFFIRTEYPDRLKSTADWKIKVHGEVKQPQDVPLKSLLDFVEPRGPVLLECSGNGNVLKFGLLSVADWAGIPIEKIVKLAQPTEKAAAMLISGFDDDSYLPDRGPPYRAHSYPTCSWVFPIETLVSGRAFLATQMNGKPLPKNHGAPVRLIVPGWYGCCEVKWVNEIKFVDRNQKATWQMLEFSDRTNQQPLREVPGFSHKHGPDLARDYRPGTIDQAAIPVRVEQWKLGGKTVYRIVGITWGGPKRSANLIMRYRSGKSVSPWSPVEFCRPVTSNSEYGIWMQTFTPPKKGYYRIEMLDDAKKPARRMRRGDYIRGVFIPVV